MYVGELTIGNISCVFPGNNLFYVVYVFHDGMVRLRAVTSSGALSLSSRLFVWQVRFFHFARFCAYGFGMVWVLLLHYECVPGT